MTFVALSGLPRSGSTLLSSILSQNPEIHAEGNSAVCQLMWDMQASCHTTAGEQLAANGRQSTMDALVSAIPAIYYRDVTATHIVDKCRSWTLQPNMEMLRRYVPNEPRVIVMVRPIEEIVASFKALYAANGIEEAQQPDLFEPGSEPLMRSLAGVEYAKHTNSGEFLFIEYGDLVDNTTDVLLSIYDFCGWEPFVHDLDNIVNQHPEDDSVYGLVGMHDVRATIGRREVVS